MQKTSKKDNDNRDSVIVLRNPNNKSKVWCPLCKGLGDNNHKIFQCPRFPTSKDKIERLKSLGGCVKCSYTTHKTHECTFKFNTKCPHCSSESHYSWLCPQTLTARKGVEGGSEQGAEAIIDDSIYGSVLDGSECEESESGSESAPEDVNVSMCHVTSKALSLPSNAILPTLQAEVQGVTAHCLLDTGCQKHFISVDLFKKAKLKAGKSIELTINGFNSSKKYNTYEVNFPIKFGGKIYNLEAVVLPDVSTRFAADGIGSLAAGFVSKGYTLADPALVHYRNIVEDLNVVLGVDAAGLFMGRVVFYGKNMQSQYLDTPGGVMPIGHSLTGYSNLRFLPTKKAKTNNSVAPQPPNPPVSKAPSPPKNKMTNQPNLKSKSTNPPPNKPFKIKTSSHSKKESTKKESTKRESTKKLSKRKKLRSNVAVTTPATITTKQIFERACTISEETSSDKSTGTGVGQCFLNSLTPGYSKQQIYGDFGSYGASSDVDLDQLMTQVMGYDQYEKTELFTALDSDVVDYIYNST